MVAVPRTSRAACVVAYKEPLDLRNVPIPDEIEPGAILVKTEVASICGSDVHLWQGELGIASRIPLPVILGHEMTGRRGADVVIEVSGGATAFPEGIDLTRRGGRYLVIGQVGEHRVTIEPRYVVENSSAFSG